MRRTCKHLDCTSIGERFRSQLCYRHAIELLGSVPVSITIANRIADAIELLDGGVAPEMVAHRLGVTLAALEKSFRRHGVDPRWTRPVTAAAARHYYRRAAA